MNADLLKRADDRLNQYFIREATQSPESYKRKVRKYWLFGAVLNVVAAFYLGLSMYTTLSKNADATLNLVRVDGVRVQEAFDRRRDVLMRNSIQRAKLQEQ